MDYIMLWVWFLVQETHDNHAGGTPSKQKVGRNGRVVQSVLVRNYQLS